MISEKRIPTILGLILLLGTIYLGSTLVGKKTNTFTKASGDCEPVNPQITNITYNTASISFTTSSDCLATINLSNRTFTDTKDKGTIHYFEIVALEESKAYDFAVISGGKNFSSDSFNFKTAQKPAKDIPTSNLAWGRVLNPDNSPATNAIVYFNIPGASVLSALVTSSGNWNIALSTSFNESLSDWFTPSGNIEENITVISPGQPQTQIVSNTSHNNPVPDIIIGQNNFSAPNKAITDESTTSLLDGNFDLSNDSSLSITNPKNNENISNKRPDFFGTAKAESILKVKIESPVVIDDEVKVESDGSWNWSPRQDLTPGEHTITVTDENNKTVSHKFIVLAAESQTSFTASSSAVTVTPTSAPTKTPTPTIQPTKTPIPTQIPAVNPSTSSGIPKTGNLLPTVMLMFLSFVSITFAFVYYKKS